MKAKFKKNWWIYLIVGVLVCALAGGIIYACVAASSDGKVKTKKISASEFSLGGLDANGKYVETKESIYTKDAFECKGLTVTPEFESQVTYQIFFYDELGEFLYKTDVLEKAFRDDVAIDATHARIIITPNKVDGEAVTMNVFNKSEYAKQLTITVSENQNSYPKTYALDMSRVTLIKGIISTGSSDELVKLRANDETTKSYLIDLSFYSEHYDVVTLENDSKYVMWFGFLTDEPVLGEEVSFSVGQSQQSSSETSVDLHIPSDAKYLCVRYSVTDAVCAPSAIIFSRI